MQHSAEITQLSSKLTSQREMISDLTSQNKYCEEIIMDIREKLSTKMKENEHLTSVISHLETEHKTLEEIHTRIQEELSVSEKSNEQFAEEKCVLEVDLNQKNVIIEKFESSTKELCANFENVVAEKTQADNKAWNYFTYIFNVTYTT